MKLVIKNGVAFATHDDTQDIESLYGECEIIMLPDGTPVDIGGPDPRLAMDATALTRVSDMSRRKLAITELADLDKYIPRGLEDMWVAISFDTSSLNEIQRNRLKRKADLRTVIAETAYLTQ